MRRAALSELRLVLLLFGGAAACAFLTGGLGRWLAAAAAAYVALGLARAVRMLRWLRAGSDEPPPDAAGLWGEIFHLAYRERRRARAAEREARARLEQYERSAQALPDGIVILDPGMRIVWSNAAAQRLTGLQDPQDRGQHIDNLLRHPDFTRYRRQGEFDEFVEIPAPLAPDQVLTVGLVPFPSGQRLLICRDVTERVRLDRVRRDFVSNVSHELRTPLAVLAGHLEILREAAPEAGGGGGLPERWRRPLEAMHGQAERMRQLVEDLLLLSRMEAEAGGARRPEARQEVDVELLIARVREEAEALRPERGHRIETRVAPGARALGSEADFRAVFSNLVRNAVQYTPAGGAIGIEWRVDGEHAWFVVTDDGEGIEAEHLPRLTERFYRVDQGRSRAEGGTGLGLAIVKHALAHYGGELEVESEPGRGSRFACRFPRAVAAPADP